MSGRPGSGAPGEEPGAPKDEGLSIFGPLELPRDESGGYPVYDDQDAGQGPGNHSPGNHGPGNYGDGNYGGYGDAGGTRVATPSMIVPPDPALPPMPPPAYPGGPPPGYPSAPGQHGPPPGPPAPQTPQGWPGGAQASPQYGPQPSAPADDPFAALFRPGPSAGPAAGPAYPPAGQASYSAPPPPVSGQPQYAAPAMPPRHYEAVPGPAPRNSRRTPIIAGSVVAAAALVVAALFAGGVFDGGDKTKTAGGTGSPSPSTSANNPPPPPTTAPVKTQAQQLDELLEVSAGSRTKVAGAVAKIERCDDIAAAVQTLNDAAAQRDQQVKTLATLKTDQIPRGDELVEWLRKAWEASARADRSFAAWGQENAEGECEDGKRAKSTDDKRDANQASGEATSAKNKAIVIWNAVARTEGLKQRTATEI